VKHYYELFGRDKVLVLPIEQLRMDSIAFEQKIHDFCQTGYKAEKVIPPANVAWRGATLALRRRINLFLKAPPNWQGDWNTLSRAYRATWKLCSFINRALPNSLHQSVETRYKRIISDRIQGYYKESNRELGKLIGIDLCVLGYDV
jgi:hypothetical protein